MVTALMEKSHFIYYSREMVKLVNQCHPVKLQMEDAIPWQFVFLMELEEWFNVSAAPDLQVGEKNLIIPTVISKLFNIKE